MSGRYSRQMQLPAIGVEGQMRLNRASVAVVGAGGLGSYVLMSLVGAGVGRVIIVDDDIVELSNLHRQPLFKTADVGEPKAEAARRALSAYNDDTRLCARVETLNPGNADSLVASVDLVVDAADSLAVTYVLSDVCQRGGKVLVTASVLEQRGYVGAFNGGAPSYRAVFPDMPSVIGSCSENGVFGPAVGVIGSLQAQVALQLILQLQPSPLGRLVSADLRTFTFGGFTFAGALEPASDVASFLSQDDLRPADLAIELRSLAEAPAPALPYAQRLLPSDLETADLPSDRRIVLCCRSGVRAFKAARALSRRGFTDVALVAARMMPGAPPLHPILETPAQ